MENYGVYIHIPFCIKKCLYCDFNSGPGTDEGKERYVEALLREIDADTELRGRSVDTVFIGGGTPSCIDPKYIRKILCKLNTEVATEVTMEVNPGTVTQTSLHNYKEMGINRLSIGVQSFDDKELRLLGRIHDATQAEQTFRMAREAGFDNINLDIMYGIPGQSLDSFKRTLEKSVALGPEHISCYSLIIEEGTPFYRLYGELDENPCLLPDEDELLSMDTYAHEYLPRMGYGRYEVSNYALPGMECQHNRGYWHRKPYRGFGLGAASLLRKNAFLLKEKASPRGGDALLLRGAASLLEGAEAVGTETGIASEKARLSELRFTGEEKIEDYIADSSKPLGERSNAQEYRALTENEAMEEFMFLGLRECDGVGADDFKRAFERDIESVFGSVLDKYIANNLIKKSEKGEKRYFFTEEGMNVSTTILADFLLE